MEDSDIKEWYKDFLNRQIELLDSLIEMESTTKWGHVALVETLQRLLVIIADCSNADVVTAQREKLKNSLQYLCEIDPRHSIRYHYMLLKI